MRFSGGRFRPPGGANFENIALVSAERAVRLPRFTSEEVSGTVSFQKTFLRRLKANDVCNRGDWLRFVAIKLNPDTVRPLFPHTAAATTLLIDRHYTSLHPYHQH